jgi:sugar phosphate isomerase/epimerase
MTLASAARPDFVLAYGCLGAMSFAERVEAAAMAGFTKIGFSVFEYQQARASGWKASDYERVLADHGVSVFELEIALGFDAGYQDASEPAPRWGPPSFPWDVPSFDRATQEDLFDLVEVLRPHHVNVLGSWGGGDPEHAVERFAALCDRAAPFGTTVAIEFMPGTSIPDVAAVAPVIEAAARQNGAVCFDNWHFERGGNPASALTMLQADKVAVIQLSDGMTAPAADDYFDETMYLRQVPGDGEWDVVTMLKTLRGHGVSAPWSIEVLSYDIAALPAKTAASVLYQSLEDLAGQVC